MKRHVVVIAFLVIPLAFVGAKEYSYLDPPTISVMDFEVDIEQPIATAGVAVDKGYYGQLVNHALVTLLVERNAANAMPVGIVGYTPALLRRAGEERGSSGATARYFPPLLKIYDKKYAEQALRENAFTVEDLYAKSAGAFQYAKLDFVVLGNVFETKPNGDYIGVNVRVMNTSRAEELYSYRGLIQKDMSDVWDVCAALAEGIITDILRHYCSQFVVKATDEVPQGADYELFCQHKQEKGSDGAVLSYNDTYKHTIQRESFYWVLPGDYVVTVYNRLTKSVREIAFSVGPREIRLIPLREEHFRVDTGSITIKGITPVDAFAFGITEKEKDAQYLWEIGQDLSLSRLEYRFTFRRGEFASATIQEGGPDWTYRVQQNEILITKVPLSRYDITVAPVAEAVSKQSITGIVRISSRQIERSSPVTVDLVEKHDIVLDIASLRAKAQASATAFQKARVTFLINPAFTGAKVELAMTDGLRTGYLLLEDVEKLIIEDEYSKEEWDGLVSIDYELSQDLRYFDIVLPKERIEARKDEIVVVDFSGISPRPVRLALPQSATRQGLFARLRSLFGRKDTATGTK